MSAEHSQRWGCLVPQTKDVKAQWEQLWGHNTDHKAGTDMATPAQTHGHTEGGQGKLYVPVAFGKMSHDQALVWGWLLPAPGELWWGVHVLGVQMCM